MITCCCCFVPYPKHAHGLVCNNISEFHWLCRPCVVTVMRDRVMHIHLQGEGHPTDSLESKTEKTLLRCFAMAGESSDCHGQFAMRHLTRFLDDAQQKLIALSTIGSTGGRLLTCTFCNLSFSVDSDDPNPYVHCECGQALCLRCGNTFHGTSLCDEPFELLEMKEVGAVICPNPRCSRRFFTEVKEGCNRLQCLACGTSYCAICNDDLTLEGYSHFCPLGEWDPMEMCNKEGCLHTCLLQGRRKPRNDTFETLIIENHEWLNLFLRPLPIHDRTTDRRVDQNRMINNMERPLVNFNHRFVCALLEKWQEKQNAHLSGEIEVQITRSDQNRMTKITVTDRTPFFGDTSVAGIRVRFKLTKVFFIRENREKIAKKVGAQQHMMLS
jgi:hypothetical protein